MATADQERIRFIVVDEDIRASGGGGAEIMRPYFHESFVDYNAHMHCDFTEWSVRYTSADAYLADFDGWSRSSQTWDLEGYASSEEFVRSATILAAEDVQVKGDCALAPKRFRGRAMNRADGKEMVWDKTVIYLMRRIDDDWKVTGMISNLPWPKEK